jgi:beta-ureidopropionase / N-carbamoyl-L-amino-acid hydrolase
MSFAELWESLLPVGRDPETGGYRRYSWTPADLACRNWFGIAAAERGLRQECDRNGNLWAWWDAGDGSSGSGGGPADGSGEGPGERSGEGPGEGSGGGARGAIATGSHLDSVPDGGAFDGPLGVAAAFAAIDVLREQGFEPGRPIAVAAFTEEEGARFGVACLGSKLSAGAVDPAAARQLRDAGGVSLADAMTEAGLDPEAIGPDDERLDDLAAYVELHIEQGRALAGLGAAVGVAESIWPHGRWLLEFSGRADHAGTTRLADRRDPMLPYAELVLAARRAAAGHSAVATIGKVVAEPGAANAICSAVRAWLDARAPDEITLERLVDEISAAAQGAAREHEVAMGMRRESFGPRVSFDADLAGRVAAAAGAGSGAGTVPVLPTGAGHDAGILASRLPTAMLFVRNPTGVSHSPAEHAELADCEAGVAALAAVLADLAR